jgi:hypothetical protein
MKSLTASTAPFLPEPDLMRTISSCPVIQTILHCRLTGTSVGLSAFHSVVKVPSPYLLLSKTCWEYACPMCYSCGCDTGIRITETKQSLKLETIGVHD